MKELANEIGIVIIDLFITACRLRESNSKEDFA